jgi:hypothetical protein
MMMRRVVGTDYGEFMTISIACVCLLQDADSLENSDDEGVMFSPPTRVLEELEEQAISRTNSKTLSARIHKTSSKDVGAFSMAIRQLGSGVFKSGTRCKDEAASAADTSLGSARPGIMHMGSGICRVGSSRSRDSSPIGNALSGESGGSMRERSRSALIAGEAYKALNLSFRSKDGYSKDSFERDESRSYCVSLAGSTRNIWEDEDIVGTKASGHNTSIGDGMRALMSEDGSPTKVINSHGKGKVTTPRKSPAGKELALIPEHTNEYGKSPKSSHKLSPRLSPIGSPRLSPSKEVILSATDFSLASPRGSNKSSMKSNDSKKIPALDMKQLDTHANGSIHLPGIILRRMFFSYSI